MDMTLRTAVPAERIYADEQSAQIAELCGSPGYLHGSLDKTGTTFLSSWARTVPDRNTQAFKAEFNTIIDMLRFDVRYGLALKNRAMMIAYCLDHAEGQLANGLEYVFRADTQDYSYLVRCAPNGEDDHVYIYPYRRDMLDRHMKQAEKGIRFLTLDGKEKFRIPDGESIQITTCGAGTRRNTARFVDNHHVLIRVLAAGKLLGHPEEVGVLLYVGHTVTSRNLSSIQACNVQSRQLSKNGHTLMTKVVVPLYLGRWAERVKTSVKSVRHSLTISPICRTGTPA